MDLESIEVLKGLKDLHDAGILTQEQLNEQVKLKLANTGKASFGAATSGVHSEDPQSAATCSMHTDPYPPTSFTNEEWVKLRDKLYKLRATKDTDAQSKRLYEIALSMNRIQHAYGHWFSVIGNNGRLVGESAADIFKQAAFAPKATLGARIAQLKQEGAPQPVTKCMATLNASSNKVNHQDTDPFLPTDKPKVANAVYSLAEYTLAQAKVVILTPEELAAKEEAEKLKAQKAVEKAAADFAALGVSEERYKKRPTVIQADPNSHLPPVNRFKDLNLTPEILKGIYAMGFDKPSRIQEHALPMILADPPLNGVFQAQSGSGKTVAFTLGMLSRCDASLEECQALCVSPTRELANQTMVVVETMGQNTGMRFRRAMPGFEVERGTKITEQVIVGTPGRVEMWLKKKFINPKHFRIFVLDEADEMFSDPSNKSRTKGIVTALPRTCQLLLFSTLWGEEARKYASMIVSKQNVRHGGRYNEIKLESQADLLPSEIKHFKIDTRAVDKMQMLNDIYAVLEVHMSIIFVKTKQTADAITKHMEDEGFAVSKLHGNLTPEHRDRVMEDFRQFKTKVLITTDVVRGYDVPGVKLVVNYDPPVTTEYPWHIPEWKAYFHRVTRCGRFGRKGVAISFISEETDEAIYAEIETSFDFELCDAPSEDLEALTELVAASLYGQRGRGDGAPGWGLCAYEWQALRPLA
jgi:ATP-dependent RNA helicase DDX19/DBP5